MDLCRTDMYVVRNLGLDLFVDSFWVFTQDLSNARVVSAFANLPRTDTLCASRCLQCAEETESAWLQFDGGLSICAIIHEILI